MVTAERKYLRSETKLPVQKRRRYVSQDKTRSGSLKEEEKQMRVGKNKMKYAGKKKIVLGGLKKDVDIEMDLK